MIMEFRVEMIIRRIVRLEISIFELGMVMFELYICFMVLFDSFIWMIL